ncbi:MAG: O-methyltransferase [Chthonomonadales bacterium]|nr:O-methyltransferase [Chthonomonadales bacterium]
MTDELFPARISEYLDSLVPPRQPELAGMEQWARDNGFPIVGPASGQLCYVIARLLGARRVFELGSGYGYSTAWFARAVKENGGGVVHHVVWDQGLSDRARGHLASLGLGDVVRFTVGEAVAALRDAEGPFDLVFNDIDKTGYPASLPVIASKLRPGGALIVDNMLWHGRVLDPSDDGEATRGIREMTAALTAGNGWTSTLVPIRDGLMVAYRA